MANHQLFLMVVVTDRGATELLDLRKKHPKDPWYFAPLKHKYINLKRDLDLG